MTPEQIRDRIWRWLPVRLRFFRPSWDKQDVFYIKVRMRQRWTPHFLGLLRTMEQYGNLGCSRTLSFYSDGDGDFRPKFKWSKKYPTAKPRVDKGGDRFWDAG